MQTALMLLAPAFTAVLASSAFTAEQFRPRAAERGGRERLFAASATCHETGWSTELSSMTCWGVFQQIPYSPNIGPIRGDSRQNESETATASDTEDHITTRRLVFGLVASSIAFLLLAIIGARLIADRRGRKRLSAYRFDVVANRRELTTYMYGAVEGETTTKGLWLVATIWSHGGKRKHLLMPSGPNRFSVKGNFIPDIASRVTITVMQGDTEVGARHIEIRAGH